MSIKTFKRIALGVIAGLVFAPFAAIAPASADPTWIQIGTGTEDDGVALTAAKYTSSTVLTANGISAFSVVAGSSVELQLIGSEALTAEAGVRVTMRGYGVVVDDTGANDLTGTATTELLTAFTATSVAGTYTLDIAYSNDDTFTADSATLQVLASVTMTVTAPSAFSAVLSKAFITSGNAGTAADADTDELTASGSSTMDADNRGSIKLEIRNGLNALMATGATVTAQITSGPGYLVASDVDVPTADQCSATPTYGAATGRAVSAFATDDGEVNLIICADGTVGAATITISVTNQLVTTALATKTFTFFGAVRTLEIAATNFTIGKAGGDTTGAADITRDLAGEVTNAGALTADTTTPAFIIAAKDSAGQLATAAAVPAVRTSDATVVASGECVLDDGSSTTYSSGEGFGLYNCSFTTADSAKSGDKATLTFRIDDPLGTSGVDYLTVTADVTVGGSAGTHTLSFDKATYNMGEAMVITRSAKDSSGNPVADGTAAPLVIFNKAIGGTAPAAGTYVGGTLATSSSRPTVFAPSSFGEFEARMTGAVAGATSAIVAKASVPAPVVPVVAAPLDKPTLTTAKSGGRIVLSGTAVDGEGDIIIYVKKVGTTAWKERAKTLEVAAPGDFNGEIKAPKGNVLIRVKQEGTGLFSNQIIVLK